ncbi:MAG: hypothetical protein KC609_18715 [Myxococcales bacterium]|nr:hypothetical protein [Myxococcales bacterium]
MERTTHHPTEFNLLNARLAHLRPVNGMRDLVLELEISRFNLSDRFQGSAQRLFGRGPSLVVDLFCQNCYWFESLKRFQGFDQARHHLHRRDGSADARQFEIWDYGDHAVDESERLRYWRALLGRSTQLQHWFFQTAVDAVEVIAEELTMVCDPERLAR